MKKYDIPQIRIMNFFNESVVTSASEYSTEVQALMNDRQGQFEARLVSINKIIQFNN